MRALSVGCTIELPNGQGNNPYFDIGLRLRPFFAQGDVRPLRQGLRDRPERIRDARPSCSRR
jgi:hypothetical protein